MSRQMNVRSCFSKSYNICIRNASENMPSELLQKSGMSFKNGFQNLQNLIPETNKSKTNLFQIVPDIHIWRHTWKYIYKRNCLAVSFRFGFCLFYFFFCISMHLFIHPNPQKIKSKTILSLWLSCCLPFWLFSSFRYCLLSWLFLSFRFRFCLSIFLFSYFTYYTTPILIYFHSNLQ